MVAAGALLAAGVPAVAAGQTGASPVLSTSNSSTSPKTSSPAKASTPAPAKVTTPAPAQQTRSSLAVARARAATAERARLAAQARQVQAASKPEFKRDLLGNLVPDIHAAAAIVLDPQTLRVLWEENSHEERSIASLTKLMTAVTFIADNPDLSRRVTVTRADTKNASVTYLAAGETISLDDLLHLMLIASDNGAARVLARTSDGSTDAFIGRMNTMASHLRLSATHYTDPSGLDSTNVSSAYDLSQLVAFAASDDRLGPIMRTAEYEAHPSFGPVTVHSTNRLLGTEVDVLAAKTGFISKAGYCLATLLQVPQGSQVAVVVLGAANSASRFWDARHLFNWVVSSAQGIFGGRPDDR
jgi:D-alanyl-D-alanine endopeptidase (penicillin-binding protein 7)